MEELRPIPDSISHKKLSGLINNAKKELSITEDTNPNNSKTDLEELFTSWQKLSKKVIKEINNSNPPIINEKSPKSLMALGAMEVHINLAIQALKAYEKE